MESHEVSKGISVKGIIHSIKPTKNVTKLMSVGFGIILISWLLSQLDLVAAVEIIRNVPISLLILGFLCYAMSFSLRAMRFRLLLPLEKPIHNLFPIVLVHYTALNIVPARLGELSYVYLLKKVNNVSAGCSISSLIVARVFDQIAISSLFLIFSCFVNLPSQWLKTVNLLVGGFLIATCVILILILVYKEKFVNLLKKLITRCKWNNYKIIQRAMPQIEDIMSAFREIQTKKKAGKVFGVSLSIWIGIFCVNYITLKAFDVNLSYVEIVLASTLIILSVLPFPSLNFVGFREITWTGIALALGVSKNVAIVSAFGTHILSILYLCLFGAYGFWKLQYSLDGWLGKDRKKLCDM